MFGRSTRRMMSSGKSINDLFKECFDKAFENAWDNTFGAKGANLANTGTLKEHIHDTLADAMLGKKYNNKEASEKEESEDFATEVIDAQHLYELPLRAKDNEDDAISLKVIHNAKGSDAWDLIHDLDDYRVDRYILLPVTRCTDNGGGLGLKLRYAFAEDFCKRFSVEITKFMVGKHLPTDTIIDMIAFTAKYHNNVFMTAIEKSIAKYTY